VTLLDAQKSAPVARISGTGHGLSRSARLAGSASFRTYRRSMSEQEQAISELESDGVLEGIRWAWKSASAQTLRSFMPSTGHDQAWLGYNAFKVFTDRLDRVFSCGRFESEDNVSRTDRGRLLREGLMAGEYEEMPRLAPELVVRSDLHGSFGWRRGSWRILLQSYGALAVDDIRWPQKSPTKREVAAQRERSLRASQLMLPLDGQALPMAAEVVGDIPAMSSSMPVTTLVGAYSIDASTRKSSIYLGRTRYNRNGERPWHWRVRLDRAGEDDRPDDPQAQRLDSPSPGPFGDAAASFPASNENQTPG
jgi:hypothetical protein